MKAQNNAPSFYHKKNNLQIFGSFYSDHYGAKLDTNEVKTYGIGGEIGYGGGGEVQSENGKCTIERIFKYEISLRRLTDWYTITKTTTLKK